MRCAFDDAGLTTRVGPEHSYWKDTGRVIYSDCGDQAAMNAFDKLARTEGIIALWRPAMRLQKRWSLQKRCPVLAPCGLPVGPW